MLILGGLISFTRMALAKQLADQTLAYLISEINSLQKEHEKVVADIKNTSQEETKKLIEEYDKKLSKFTHLLPGKIKNFRYEIK